MIFLGILCMIATILGSVMFGLLVSDPLHRKNGLQGDDFGVLATIAIFVLIFAAITIGIFTDNARSKVKTRERPEMEYLIKECPDGSHRDTTYIYHFK